MKILGIDYGRKRVGVAVSCACLAEPLLILENNPELFAHLQEIITAHRVQELVVGISEGEMAQVSLEFATKLQQQTGLRVHLVDETLSTHQVREYLRQLPAKKRRGRIDHYAAAVILQNYLDNLFI